MKYRMKHKKKILDGLDDVKAVKCILTDAQAYDCPKLFPDWTGDGKDYHVGDRVLYNGKLYKCLQVHTSQAGWNPATWPAGWAEILPGQEGTEIGEWVQPGANNGYKYGDMVYHNGKKWRSIFDPDDTRGGNVWEPGAIGVYTWEEVLE